MFAAGFRIGISQLFSLCTAGKIPSENELIMGLSGLSATKWYKLGVALNLSDGTLNTIEVNNMNTYGVERCLSGTLIRWYNNTPGGTWGDICAALYAIDERVLARKVARAHGKPVAILQFVSIIRYHCHSASFFACLEMDF